VILGKRHTYVAAELRELTRADLVRILTWDFGFKRRDLRYRNGRGRYRYSRQAMARMIREEVVGRD